jgi:large subunit ribosomal protein L15
MPIQRRLPKFGFTNPTRIEYKAVNVADLQKLSEKIGSTAISIDAIRAGGLASAKDLVKVLGNGELNAKLEVSANAFSKSAIAKIEAAGGKATAIE